MRRHRVAGERGPVHEQNPAAGTGQEHRQGRSGAACSDHDHVVCGGHGADATSARAQPAIGSSPHAARPCSIANSAAAGARRDADLGVGVLDVAVGGLGRDAERPGDLLGLQAAREQADDLGLALGQPRRAARAAARGCPAASSTAATASASSRPARASAAERLGGPLAAGAPRGAAAARSSRGRRRRRRAARAGRRERAAPTRRGGSPSRRGARGGRRRPGRARRGTASGRARARSGRRAAAPAPTRPASAARASARSGPGRRPARGRGPARPAGPRQVGGVQPARCAAALASSRHAGRVPGQVRRDEVGEVAHRRQRPVDRLALQGQPRRRLAGERLVPRRRPRRRARGSRAAPSASSAAIAGSNAPPGPLADDAHGARPRRRACAGTSRRGRRARSARAAGSRRPWPAGSPLPSQRSVSCANSACTERGRPSRSRQHLRHLAQRSEMAARAAAPPAAGRARSHARAPAPGGPAPASARMSPPSNSRPRAEHDRDEVRPSATRRRRRAPRRCSASAVQPT